MQNVAKKMTDYLKDGTKAKYEMNPENFPESNYKIDNPYLKGIYNFIETTTGRANHKLIINSYFKLDQININI